MFAKQPCQVKIKNITGVSVNNNIQANLLNISLGRSQLQKEKLELIREQQETITDLPLSG